MVQLDNAGRSLIGAIAWKRALRPGAGLIWLLLAAMLAIVPSAGAMLRQLNPAGPSPAAGHAQVIAHGVAPLPAPTLAWRIVLDTAEPPAAAAVEERALGFALADRVAIVINDVGSGAQQRLAPGEAAFVAAAARQQRASLDGVAADYYRLALVPSEAATDAGGDRLLFAGEPFAAPVATLGGGFDLDLVRDVLAPDEESALPNTGTPTLVLATSGVIEVAASGSLPVRLAAGQAAAFAGELAIHGVGPRPATFVAALIGPEVPPPPGPATGSISLAPYNCPAGMTVATLVREECTIATADFAFEIASVDGVIVRDLTHAKGQAGGFYAWSDLPLGTYVVRERRLPDGFTVYAIPGAQLDRQLDAYLVTLDSATPNAQFIVFHVSGEYAGSVSARIFACPPTMRRDNLVGEACQPATDVAVTLLLPDGSQRGLDTAVVKGNTVTWSDLPPGEFEIAQGELAPPYADSYAPEATASALNPRAYRITLSEETPNAVVTIYNLQSTSGQALDSDGDGLNDAAEPGIGTDPLDPDTDGDGRADGDEIGPRRVNTDPLDADSDDDGVADGDELANGTDPNDPISR